MWKLFLQVHVTCISLDVVCASWKLHPSLKKLCGLCESSALFQAFLAILSRFKERNPLAGLHCTVNVDA